MSLPSAVLKQLNEIRYEVFETFADSHHRVDNARQAHVAFRRRRRVLTAGQLDLLDWALQEAAAKVGAGWDENGGRRSVVIFHACTRYFFRVRTANHDQDGGYLVMRGGNPLRDLDADEETLITDEAWVLGVVRDDRDGVVDMMTAKILGATDETVPHLVLATPIQLTGTPSVSAEFFDSQADDLDDRLGTLLGDSHEGEDEQAPSGPAS